MKCNQATCTNEGSHRFTWPGRDEAVICDTCLPKLRGVANAMGLYLQVRPMSRCICPFGVLLGTCPEHGALVPD